MTPLMVASCKGHSSVVRVLLQGGAVANATSQVRYSSCQMHNKVVLFAVLMYTAILVLQCHIHTNT